MNKKNLANLKKYFAIASIYLIISLTFFTAHAMAMLNYTISDDNGVSGFASREGDSIKIDVTANSNVSFVVGQNTENYAEIPLDGCTFNNVTGLVNCLHPFRPTDINTNIENIPFVLKQESGTPAILTGNLYIDGLAPQEDYFNVTKDGNGLYFDYSFTDYLTDTSEGKTACEGSGIGYLEIDVQNRPIFPPIEITTENCTVSGTFFKNFSNSYNDKVRYSVIVRDRVGNEYRPGPKEISGDFRPPLIANTFKIMKGGEELTVLSTNAETDGDVVVQITDTSLNTSNVYGDLSNLNINPAVNIPYKNIEAGCVKESGDTFICTFRNISLRPASAELSITLTAKDNDGNPATKTLKKVITLGDNPGTVLYLGPAKSHCTSDMKQCYSKSGRQFLYAEIDAVSSYNITPIYLGVGDDQTFAICRLNNTWTCTGMYNIQGVNSISMYVAESYDDYGNMLESNVQRTIIIDDAEPSNISGITVTSNNNNMDCAVVGDELTLKVKVQEANPELKIYVNTSGFTSHAQQKGACTLNNGVYDCELKIKGFSSVASKNPRIIILEDLAGNKHSLPYTFEVCQSVATATPNVIYDVNTQNTVSINRRTASKISVNAYIPVKFNIQEGAKLMYLRVEKCAAPGISGLDVMGPKHYFMPNYGDQTTLVLAIGHEGAMLPEDHLDINCTISARVRVARTVFTQDERETFTIKVATENVSIGLIDDNTNEAINVVKKRLRQIDKELKNVEGINKILEGACKLAEGLGKANSVMQTVRAILYPIALGLYMAGWTAVAGKGMWGAVQAGIGQFHKIVSSYIWPPGVLPVGKGSSSASGLLKGYGVGSAVKYMCMVYTCKLYDVGTYTGLVFEAVSKGVGGYSEGTTTVTKTSTVSQSGTVGTSESKWSSVSSDNNYKSKSTKLVVSTPTSAPGYDKGGTGYIRTTTTTTTLLKTTVRYDSMTSGSKTGIASREAIANRGESLTNALNGHQWVIDPYKSVHYDGACIPAQIYNLKKEKQINCMYIACMQSQAETGIPKVMCDGDYKINKCLYLDSAEFILHHGDIWQSMFNGIADALANSGLGLVISTLYLIFCKKDLIPAPDIAGMNIESPEAFRSVGCGLAGSYFGIQEMVNAAKNPFMLMRSKLNPTEKQDYCKGIDYSEASDVYVEGEGGFSD